MVSETASVEQGGSKAQWISDVTTAARTKFPSIAAILWFDQMKENDWRFTSSSAAQSSFRTLANDSEFRTGAGTARTNALSPAATITLKVSANADLSGATALQSANLSGSRYVRADVSGAAVRAVSFYLDDPTQSMPARQVETFAPYDLVGGGALSTPGLRKGIHTLTVVAQLSSGGGTVVTGATFTTTGS
jgi:hypothetical protein